MDDLGKRIGYGVLGALFGAGTAYIAMFMLGKIYVVSIIVITMLCFIVAFFGGKKVVEYILRLDDYI